MDNQDKIYELLEKLYVEFTHRFEKLEKGQEKLEKGYEKLVKGHEKLEKGQQELVIGQQELVKGQQEANGRLEKLEIGQKDIKELISEIETKNDARHIVLSNKIDELRKDLSTVEIVTASNYADIAKLKSVK